MDHINNCARYGEMIFAYAEEIIREEMGGGGKTPDREKWKDLMSHLEVCEACQKELSECIKMLREVEEDPIEVPEDLHGSIMSYVKAEAKVIFTKVMGGVAAVFVLVAGVFAAIGSGAFEVSNDMAADGIFDFAAGNASAPEADYNGSSGEIYDEADGDASAPSKEQSKTESVPSDQVDVEIEAVETEAAEEAERPEEVDPEPETDAPGTPDTTPETASPEAPTEAEGDNENATDIEIVMEDFISSTEYDGGSAYVISGDGAAEVFDGMTDMSETDSYAWGEYFILLFDVSLLDDVDRELTDLAYKYGAKLEGFKFGETETCVAIIIKR